MKVVLYDPPMIFDIFIRNGYAEVFEEGKNYRNHLVVCPVFWGLNSIDQLICCEFDLAITNTDQQGYQNKLIPADIKQILQKHNAILLLYNEWETRDLERYDGLLLYFTKFYLKVHPGKVVYSICDYIGHMKRPPNPHIISYDWMHTVQKQVFKQNDVIKQVQDKRYPILSLNYRGNMERYAYCFYLFQRHRGKALFSYLDHPKDEDAKQLNEGFKTVLGPDFSEECQQKFNNAIPVRIDGTLPAQHQTKTLHEFFEQSYVHVMFETNWLGVHSKAQQVSEKTYLSLRVGKPFMIFTTKGGVLAHLKKQGYKTFEPFINEGYDNPEIGYYERFQLLLKETDRICSLTKSELKQLDYDLKPIVDFNIEKFAYAEEVGSPFDMINLKRLRHPMLRLGILKGYFHVLRTRYSPQYHHFYWKLKGAVTSPFDVLVHFSSKYFGKSKSK